MEEENSSNDDQSTKETVLNKAEAIKTDSEDTGLLSEVTSCALLKDDSGITLETSLSNKSDVCEDEFSSIASCSPAPVATGDGSLQEMAVCSSSNLTADSLDEDSALAPSSSSVSESSADLRSKPKIDEEEISNDADIMDGAAKNNENGCLNSIDSDSSCSKKDKKVCGVLLNLEHVSTQENGEDSEEQGRNKSNGNDGAGRQEEVATEDVEMEGVAPAATQDSLSSLSPSEDEDGEHNNTGTRYLSRRLYLLRKRRLRRRRAAAGNLNSDSSSLDDDDDVDNERVEGANMDSDNESDDDNGGDDDLQTDSATDSENTDGQGGEEVMKTVDEIVGKTPPSPNWYALHEIHKREYGCTLRQSLSSFREKVQGSLHMARRLKLVDSMKYHEGCVNSLCFNRIGTLLASGSDDLNVVLWNWQRSCPSLIFSSGHRSNVFQAKFMPYSGDCHIVTCARDGQVRLAELSLTGVCKNTKKLVQHKGAAHKLALEYDTANVFLSCGEDAVTYLFDLREERPHRLVTTKENDKKVPLYSIHSNPTNPQQFCVGGRDHYIRIYDKRKIAESVNGGVLKRFCPDHLVDSPNKANVTCACYNYNGTEILGSYNDEDIYLFNNSHSDGANYTQRYRGHRNNETVKGVNFYGPKSEFIVSGSDCGNLYMWEKRSEAIVTFLHGDKAGVINVLEPHPNLPVLATSGLDHDVKLWVPTNPNPRVDTTKLKKTVHRNLRERKVDMNSEPTVMSGQMLWMLMHHFRNTARRRLREEGQELSTTEDDDDEGNNSDDSEATNEINQCTQS